MKAEFEWIELTEEEKEFLKGYKKCSKCWAYTKNIENHQCDGMMLKLVEHFKLKVSKWFLSK